MTTRINQILAFLKDTPNDLFLNHALALEYIKQENTELATSTFLNTIKIDENYVATYYHLGKLYEKLGLESEAIEMYTIGMQKSKIINDQHSYNELRSALENLEF